MTDREDIEDWLRSYLSQGLKPQGTMLQVKQLELLLDIRDLLLHQVKVE